MRYFFDILDGVAPPDKDGIELSSFCDAQKEALRYAADMLSSAPPEYFWTGRSWKLAVTDGPNGTGNILFSLNIDVRYAQ